MKIVEQSFEILSPQTHDGSGINEFYRIDSLKEAFATEAKLIEIAGRTAYKSEDKITTDSYDKFIRGIISRGHEAVIEFGSMAVKFVTDRGISHEIVRHRLASFCQESTRYCSYASDKFGKEITVIKPSTWDTWRQWQKEEWEGALEEAENRYLNLVQQSERPLSPQQARAVLPNSLKTEIVVRANFREWRHIFRLRALSRAAHPDMRALMIPLYLQCKELLPCVFDMEDPE
jgi:thymidylate synthase (FAD)